MSKNLVNKSLSYKNGLLLDFEKCNLVFVYGTLKSGYGNNYLLKNSELISKEAFTVEHFELYNVGFPYAKFSKKGEKIKGELYKLDSLETFEDLDFLEGYPTHYKRKIIKVMYKKDGKVYKAKAWIYYNQHPHGRKITLRKFDNDLSIYYYEWE